MTYMFKNLNVTISKPKEMLDNMTNVTKRESVQLIKVYEGL